MSLESTDKTNRYGSSIEAFHRLSKADQRVDVEAAIRMFDAANTNNDRFRKYIGEPTACDFHADNTSRIKGVMSAFGQGKSTMCIMEMLRISAMQAPSAVDNVRYSSWAIVRQSYKQLKTTTLKTFRHWIPADVCPLVFDSPIRGNIDKMPLPDGTFLSIEFQFMSMDGPTSDSDLASLEVTGFWVNEVAEFRNQKIINDVFRRTGRYKPPGATETELTWSGVLVDYNPPAVESWLYHYFETNPPVSRALYKIPAPILALFDEDDPDDLSKVRFLPNPKGECIQYQPKKIQYWLEMAEEDRYDFEKVKRFCLGQYTYGVEGQPVFPSFSVTRHSTLSTLLPERGSLLLIGMDWGLDPAAVIGQYYRGKLHVLSNISSDKDKQMDLTEFFATRLVPHINDEYPNMSALLIGEPSGTQKSMIDSTRPFELAEQFGFDTTKPRSNKWEARKSAVNWFLKSYNTLLISQRADTLFHAMCGGYQYEETRNAHALPSNKPLKNHYSHTADAFQALCQYCLSGGDLYSDADNTDEHGFTITGPRPLDNLVAQQPKKYLYY